MKKEPRVDTFEATIEKSEVVIVSRRQVTRAWCRNCGQQVRMIRPEQAARYAAASARSIYRTIDGDKVSYIEDPANGSLLVCLDDVLRALRQA